ncbi:efflux RND transporter periplasmic adaptor subunit [Endozoicomonadaceae bacterium StTr2]
MPAPAVSVISVPLEPVGEYREFVARTEASETVELRARVEGFIETRGFTEGANVEKDQLLFRIDQAPFKAALSQAKASLASAKAEAIRAKADLERGQELYPKGHMSKADLDKLTSAAAQARANVQVAKAQLETAEINLSYTEIHAPFSGKIGKETYSVGNLVGPSSSPLAELIQIDPVHVNFQVNEKEQITYQQSHAQNPDANEDFNLSLKLPNGSVYNQKGSFDFADIKVDEATGTVNIRASFPNPDKLLLPGLYVTLVADSTKKQPMPLIPQAAVQENQQGRFVLVVDENNQVETRIIETGRRIGPMWSVKSGLKAGEQVIVSGLQKVRPGIAVNPVLKVVDKTTGVMHDADNAPNSEAN